jgi:hypothetical protein
MRWPRSCPIPDDEILFVDYNTPDDHPTFPEAIHDTLTDKAKQGHARAAHPARPACPPSAQNPLVALEAQSRNVALRRSNPRNRWILYTNTDMLLVPRNEKESLSDILGAIPDGFYQVPRFEIPEMLWEAAFDRRDPVGNLAKLRDWSVRFHLNQVVHNYMPMKYDALGDFQAALRDDMFAIHGFDEDMILGWHCDSNLAARLALYRGRVDTLVDKVFGYHCDHTRVAAANNKGRATRMNDQDRFIWNVATPYVPAQAETWGWPDTEIEEIRLDRDTPYQRYSAGLDKAIEPATTPFVETSLEWQLFDDLTYDLPHTLPFVCDQVVTFPRSTNLMLVATRPDFVSSFAKAWKGMGFTGPILIPRSARACRPIWQASSVRRSPSSSRRPSSSSSNSASPPRRPTEPVRAGRQIGPIDKKRLRVAERLFKRAGRDRGRDASRGPARAASLHRRQRDLQQVLAHLHELRRRQHQSLLQPGPGRSAARGRLAQGKGIEIPGTPRPVSRALQPPQARRAEARGARSLPTATLSMNSASGSS